NRFSLDHENAFSPIHAPCEVLRAMNLSNMVSKADPKQALAAMCRPLVDKGLWILGDKADGASTMSITIFQRRGSHVTSLRDIESPFRLKEAILSLELPSS